VPEVLGCIIFTVQELSIFCINVLELESMLNAGNVFWTSGKSLFTCLKFKWKAL